MGGLAILVRCGTKVVGIMNVSYDKKLITLDSICAGKGFGKIGTYPFTKMLSLSHVQQFIFGIIVSILSILVYRACYRYNGFNTTDLSGPFSVYQTSQSCKYDMNARNDESFFRNHVEPVHTKSYGHSDRW